MVSEEKTKPMIMLSQDITLLLYPVIRTGDQHWQWSTLFKSLREKCPYSEFFCSLFSRIISVCLIILWSLYLVQMQENKEQKSSEYGHIFRSE